MTHRPASSSQISPIEYSLEETPSKDTLAVAKTPFFPGDSVIRILKDADKVSCHLPALPNATPQRQDTVCQVSSELAPIIRFLLTDQSNFISNEIVYGLFTPTVEYLFDDKDGNLSVELDFGLRKWRILNQQHEVLSTADMKDTNLQLLRATRMVFPNDSTLTILNENLTSLSK